MVFDDGFVSGNDKAFDFGFDSYRVYIQAEAARLFSERKLVGVWSGKVKSGKAFRLDARIDFERWVVDCPEMTCNGCEVVEPEDPFFFCMSCGNARLRGDAYTVIFPGEEDRLAIGAELARRPLHRPVGQGRSRTAYGSVPAIRGLGRNWRPGEDVEELAAQARVLGLSDSSEVKSDPLPAKAAAVKDRGPQGKSRDRSDGDRVPNKARRR